MNFDEKTLETFSLVYISIFNISSAASILRTGIQGEYTQTDETEINGTKMFTMQLVIDGRHVYKVRKGMNLDK